MRPATLVDTTIVDSTGPRPVAPAEPIVSTPSIGPEPALHIALFGRIDAAPPAVSAIMAGVDWCSVVPLATDLGDAAALRQIDVAIVIDDPRAGLDFDAPGIDEELLAVLRKNRVGAAVLTSRPALCAGYTSGVVCLPPDVSLDWLRGALGALAHLRPVMRQFDIELSSIELLGGQLAKHFGELDEELRLASRLQRDFLPRELPKLPHLRFSTLFRPCSFVSGDIFDVFRLDEHHVGLYVADAVGHGLAAGLLTMFIKNRIAPKQITGNSYVIMPPDAVMAQLNDALAAQDLPDSQFITAFYGMINTRTMQLRYTSGGHPSPILIQPDGTVQPVAGTGCLLGIFPRQEFQEFTVQLERGQRLLIFSDGLEPTLYGNDGEPPQRVADDVAAIIRKPAAEFLQALVEIIDSRPGSLSRADDVTLLLIDVE